MNLRKIGHELSISGKKDRLVCLPAFGSKIKLAHTVFKRFETHYGIVFLIDNAAPDIKTIIVGSQDFKSNLTFQILYQVSAFRQKTDIRLFDLPGDHFCRPFIGINDRDQIFKVIFRTKILHPAGICPDLIISGN